MTVKLMKKLIFSGFLLVFVLSPLLTFAADSPGRYFVKSEKGFWKNAFGVRHTFLNGFTADLSDWQVRVGRVFGLDIEPVKLLFILPEDFNALAQESGTVIKGKRSVRILPSDQTPWGIEAIYQDNLIQKTSGGKGVNVAVLDTGILASHPDLKSRIKECKDFTSPRAPVVDGKCEDKNGHGTHVSGIIAANAGLDALGIYGVAPESNLFVYRVCSAAGSCYADDISVALKTAANNGANIVNVSLGSDGSSPLIVEGIDYADSKGVLVVAAAGNDGPYFGSIDYPAANKPTISVGAFGVFINVADWSSRGINSTTTPYLKEEKDMEFAMPGVNIESTWKDGGYAILSGTSMAAPFLSGLAAKYWQFLADKPAEATRLLLHSYARDIDVAGDDDASGWGFPQVFVTP